MKDFLFYLRKAHREKWAIPQFNVSSAVEMQGITKAAKNQQSPVIIAVSPKAASAIGIRQVIALINSYKQEMQIPLFLNFDHGKNVTDIMEAISLGFDMVHFDGSELSFHENIRLTKKVALKAHEKNLLVEGELGKIVGNHTVDMGKRVITGVSDFTNPMQTDEFVKKTGVDLLATSFGIVHGIYKNKPVIDHKRLEYIVKETNDVFLTMHGGSGVGNVDIQKIIKIGITKINISTELKSTFTTTLRKTLKNNPTEVSSYKLFPPGIDAVQNLAEKKIQQFGSSGKI